MTDKYNEAGQLIVEGTFCQEEIDMMVGWVKNEEIADTIEEVFVDGQKYAKITEFFDEELEYKLKTPLVKMIPINENQRFCYATLTVEEKD